MSLQLRALVAPLLGGLHQLQHCLAQAEVHHADLGLVPPTPVGTDHAPVTTIAPELLRGPPALEAAGRACRDLFIQDGYSQKSARRYVGSLHLAPGAASTAKIRQLVNDTNRLKSEIRDLVTSQYPTRYERFDALHTACPGAMTLHLYRQIPLLDQEPVKSLRYTWKRKNSQYRPDKDQFLDQLQEEREHAQDDYRLPLAQLIERVKAVPDDALRLQRPIKVHPVANVVTASQRMTVSASLPILVIQDAPYQTTPVPIFDAKRTRARRSDMAQYEVIGSFRGTAVLQKLPD